MKLTKKLSRIAATVLALALLVCTAAVPAMAADEGLTKSAGETSITGITVTDTITTDGNTYAPNTSFTITVTAGAGGQFNDGTGTVTAEAGIAGGLTGTTIAFAPSGSTPSNEYTQTGTLAVNDSVFAAAGIYHYQVKQETGNYEGINYDTATYDVYLYVLNNTEGTGTYVAYAVVNNDANGKVDLQFTNDYGKNNDTTHDVTVVKNVAGTAGDKVNDEFKFDVSVTSGDDEKYKVVYHVNAADTTGTEITIDANDTPKTLTIKHDGSITIYGLSASDTYTIAEQDVTGMGYSVDNNKSNDRTGTVTGVTTTDGARYIVTNTKNANIPTDVIMNVAPYALMVIVAVAAGVVFLRKRREE